MKTTGYIGPDGRYVKGEDKSMGFDVNPTHKEWRHDMERKQFAKEIIQPFKNGKANKEFIDNYPEESKKYFTEDVIKKLTREL
jgi:hypothetical protein